MKLTSRPEDTRIEDLERNQHVFADTHNALVARVRALEEKLAQQEQESNQSLGHAAAVFQQALEKGYTAVMMDVTFNDRDIILTFKGTLP